MQPVENLQFEELLEKIKQLQSIMIAVATRESDIKERQQEYTEIYQDIQFQIGFLQAEGLPIVNPNNFLSLWDWHKYYLSNLEGYSSRVNYIYELYSGVINQIENTLHSYSKRVDSSVKDIFSLKIEQIEDFLSQIKQLQSIMIDVATSNSQIQYEETKYISLYRKILSIFRCLNDEGISVENPNSFSSLWQWCEYWKNQIEDTYSARIAYIDCLYESVLKPIREALYKHRLKRTSFPEFAQDLKQRFTYQISSQTSIIKSNENLQGSAKSLEVPYQQTTSAVLPVEMLTSETENLDNSFNDKNFDGNWTEKNAMNPEIFLVQEDVVGLEEGLERLFSNLNNDTIRSVFVSSGVEKSFTRNINFNSTAFELTSRIVAKSREYKVSAQRLDYHPLISLLAYLLGRYHDELEDQEISLFTKLVEQGQENLKAFKTRRAVGRIESPQGNGIATGVVIGKNLLLTCNHVFSKTQVNQAWIRFNYKANSPQSEEDLFELDMDFVCHHHYPDYALVRIKGGLQQEIAISSYETLDSEQDIRIIHHPQGKPLVISSLGQIKQVGEDYIQHNVSTDNGSSGAPIFNRQWELIAIHRGNHGIGGRNVEPGTVEGIPLRAFWDKISPHLA